MIRKELRALLEARCPHRANFFTAPLPRGDSSRFLIHITPRPSSMGAFLSLFAESTKGHLRGNQVDLHAAVSTHDTVRGERVLLCTLLTNARRRPRSTCTTEAGAELLF